MLTITWAQFAWAVGLFLVWNAFLVGIIKILLSREVSLFGIKLDAADAKAGKALAAQLTHEQAVEKSLAALRLELNQKSVCSNHQRMETDNEKQFVSLDKMHASIRGISERIIGVANNVDLLLKHHINGGN